MPVPYVDLRVLAPADNIAVRIPAEGGPDHESRLLLATEGIDEGSLLEVPQADFFGEGVHEQEACIARKRDRCDRLGLGDGVLLSGAQLGLVTHHLQPVQPDALLGTHGDEVLAVVAHDQVAHAQPVPRLQQIALNAPHEHVLVEPAREEVPTARQPCTRRHGIAVLLERSHACAAVGGPELHEAVVAAREQVGVIGRPHEERHGLGVPGKDVHRVGHGIGGCTVGAVSTRAPRAAPWARARLVARARARVAVRVALDGPDDHQVVL
mmetsp:Transcript_11775/g.30726  ORF Transcript_11775/g.30726 Transcript_11775/m.30726 type:complete len:267 (+) Transcript_11775:365-1165(+)